MPPSVSVGSGYAVVILSFARITIPLANSDFCGQARPDVQEKHGKNVSTSPRDSAYEYEGIPEYELYTVKCGLQSRHSYVSIVERFLCQCTTFPSFHPQKPTNVREETRVPNLPTQSSPLPGGF